MQSPLDDAKALSAALVDFKPRRLAAIPWSEGQAHKPAPDLIKGAVAAGFNLEFGASSSGKSFHCIDKAVAVARDVVWNGHRVKGGPVLYIAAEAAAGIWRRLEAYALDRLGDQEPRPPLYVIPQALNLLASDEDVQVVVAEARRLSAVLVVIDTVSRVFGGGDENSSQDMARFVSNLDRIRADTGAAILAVHHTGKDSTKGARGSSVLFAAADFVTEVERLGDGSTRRVTVRKSREGEDGAVQDFRLRVVELGEDDDGDPITSCVVDLIEGDAGPQDRLRSLPAQKRKALDILRNLVISEGEPPPAGDGWPTGIRVVRADRWRTEADRAGLSAADQEADRSRIFRKCREYLNCNNYIGTRDGWVWVV